jgi:hypothetical protein
MEFLRFGSSIPGSYWGTCSTCIIQNFKVDPDAPASIQLVCGDGGEPLGDQYLGKTYREIFEGRLRIGTFSDSSMPNHTFLAIMTSTQINSGNGYKWLKILHENGFEFIRAFDNSVYSGEDLYDEDDPVDSENPNYLFGLFRNIGQGRIQDPYHPPHAWKELGPEQHNDEYHLKRWEEIGYPVIYTQEELKSEKIPVTMAGLRSKFPQQSLELRESSLNFESSKSGSSSAPFQASSDSLEAVSF